MIETPKRKELTSIKRLVLSALFAGVIEVLGACSQNTTSSVADGTYYGYDELPNLSPDVPEAYWYHENTLTVRGSTVRLTTKPFTLINGKAVPQPADGGFYTYEGTLSVEGRRTIVDLRLIACDYCDVPAFDSIPSHIVRGYVVQTVPEAAFELDRVRYQTRRDPKLHPTVDNAER